jgi:transcriptional regulator with XRE-family HTH domain
MADNELGAFIRSRRERLAPEAVGFPSGGRRRTPGLRRSELATVAGISVDYLIRLEQGRDTRPSPSVVAALADALRLDDEDRMHLKHLGAITTAGELCPARVPAARVVRPAVAAVLASLEPAPALVLNHLADVLAWTDTYAALARPLGILDPDPPNLIRFTYTDRRARTAYPDWDRVAVEQVANLRSAGMAGDPEVDALVAELAEAAGDEFTRRWEARPVERKTSGTKRIVHPEVGELRIEFETMQLADRDNQRLVVYLPGDEATAAAFDQLSGRRPGALHAVGG